MSEFWSNIQSTFTEELTGLCLRIIGGGLALLVGFRLIRWIMRLMDRSHLANKLDPTVRTFCNSLLSAGLKILLIIAVAGMVGVPTASIIAVLGSAGVAIGLALQGSLSNLAGGVMLLWNKPFSKGDYIEVPGITPGVVTDITVFYTTLRTVDNLTVVIPNGAVSGAALTNYSAMPERRVDIDFSIAYEADIDAARACLLAAAEDCDKMLDLPAPAVFVTEMADSAVLLGFRGWCKTTDYLAARYAMNESGKKALDKAGVSIPYPQVDVHMK